MRQGIVAWDDCRIKRHAYEMRQVSLPKPSTQKMSDQDEVYNQELGSVVVVAGFVVHHVWSWHLLMRFPASPVGVPWLGLSLFLFSSPPHARMLVHQTTLENSSKTPVFSPTKRFRSNRNIRTE